MTLLRLTDLSIITAAGSETGPLMSLLTGDQSTYSLPLDTSSISGRAIPIGRVDQPLKEVPLALLPYRSRNFQLLISCVDRLKARINDLVESFGSERIGIVLGSSNSGIEAGEQAVVNYLSGQEVPDHYFYSQQEMGTGAIALRKYLDLCGPAYVVSTACSSSAKVFRSAAAMINGGVCDAVIVGGSDPLCKLATNGFATLDLISNQQSLPFSANRSGINIGEGAALFILVKAEGGVQLVGVGEASDAYHFSSPDPEGKGASKSIRSSLEHAQVTPNDVSYVNLHGTGTIHNDMAEARAVFDVFADSVYCSSTKPLTGHTLGASGAIEVGFCWLILNRYLSSPDASLNLPLHRYDQVYDPSLPKLKIVEKVTSLSGLKRAIVLSNSFGFGGSNCCVALAAEHF